MRNDRGNFARAIPELRRAMELAPHETRYTEVLSSAYVELHDCPHTIEVSELAIQRFSPHAGQYHMYAVNCLNASDPERTLRHLLSCLVDEPARTDCATALVHTTKYHPRAPEYRRILRALLQTDEFSSLAGGPVEELLEEP